MKAWLRTPWVGILAAVFAGGAAVAQAKTKEIRLVVLDEPYLSFPLALQNEGIYSGDVRVVVSIETDGRIVDSLMLGYTHPSLGAVVEKALPRYRFQPILVDGKPVVARVGLTFNFSISGLILSHTSLDALQARFKQAEPPSYTSRLALTTRELDQPLAVRRSIQPLNVPGSGSVVLDFYVDETGRARLPAVKSADRSDFAEAATEALLQWEFAPPTRDGAPVIVRASQKFVFAQKENG